MSDIFLDVAIPLLLRNEGCNIDWSTKPPLVKDSGYSNDPLDHGGETKFGISARFLESSPKNLTLDEAIDIYRNEFWYAYKCDKLVSVDFKVAVAVFDMVVNGGPAVKLLQKSLGVKEDGLLGPETLNQLKLSSYSALPTFCIARMNYYCKLVQHDKTQSKFLLGWVLRVIHVFEYLNGQL
jgi:lysozyme family protein